MITTATLSNEEDWENAMGGKESDGHIPTR